MSTKKSPTPDNNIQVRDIPVTKTPEYSLLSTMTASCLSGMLARIPCHPLDTAKARLQAVNSTFVASSSNAPRSIAQTISHSFKTNGLKGVYAGFPMAFFGSAPGTVLYFTTYETSKSYLNKMWTPRNSTTHSDTETNMINFASGLIAETISCVVWVPIDVVKERLQVQSLIFDKHGTTLSSVKNSGPKKLTYYRNTIHALQTIYKTEKLRGIYKGYGATLASFGPFSAIYLSSYEWFRKSILKKINYVEKNDSTPPPWVFLTSGISAALFASILTNPFDLIRLRIQIQRAVSNSSTFKISPAESLYTSPTERPFNYNYRNLLHGLYTAVKTEGISVLMRGVWARAAFTIPNTAITITLFDYIRTRIHKLE